MSNPIAVERRQRVCILGSTGSIGTSTLDVLSQHRDRYEVFALTARCAADTLFQQCVQWRPRYAALHEPAVAAALQERLARHDMPTQVLSGPAALEELAGHPQADIVMAAVVGAAGLRSCLAAAHAGKRLLLANKEALVVGGALFVQAVQRGGGSLLPVDSEHSAIFQCLPHDAAAWADWIDHIVLTASGGPFRTRDPATLHAVTPEQAVAHPNWVMGRKISVDSATMMNKALEVIEAKWLFHLSPRQVRVVIHPQSIVHSMVVCRDRSVLAQMGTPDMRVPIACALAWPRRIASGAGALDFTSLSALTFEPVDARRFPGLQLAWDALEAPDGTTTVLNAANEVAVAAFLDGALRFDQIHQLNASLMEAMPVDLGQGHGVDDLIDLDQRARALAGELVLRMSPP